MRDIKFRAWSKYKKMMAMDIQKEYDTIAGVRFFRNGVKTEEEPGETSFDSYLQDDDYVVMQSTGLKDKNGWEIYEGDIVKSEWQHDGHINRDHTFTGQVTFGGNDGEPAFYMFSADGDYYMPFVSYDREELISVEVIGNIYENSELIEGDK